MQILMNTGGIAQTNAFVIADEDAKQAALFDAPDHTAAAMLDEVQRRGWNLIGLWLTHGHFDHLADHAVVKLRFPNAKILIHPIEADRLRNPGSQMFQLPFTIPPGEPDELIDDGQTLRIGSLEARVIHTPGHAPGHVAFHFPRERALVGGDLIMMHSVGRTDLPGSSSAQLQESLRKVMALPDETQLLPGHGDPSTIGEEREVNPYVREALGLS
jgi:glyoxylase-like metal-dependent hydrolase (beta-lactamase superfamily II)